MQSRRFAMLGLILVGLFGASAHAADATFDAWLESFKKNAIEQGIAPKVVEDAFTGLEEDEIVVKLDRKQPESKITLTRYLENTITQRRIEKGREMLVEHADILKKVQSRYGVQPKYIVALWAIESDFGRQQGNFSVIQSLATLAYEGRRAELFGRELLAALKILQSEEIPSSQLLGSWAGAMGNSQFMPSTFLRYAVDANGDNHRDIWNSEEDTFASIANYLSSIGWDGSQEWGRAARVPSDFKTAEAIIKHGHSADAWQKRGLTYDDGSKPAGMNTLYAIYPGSDDEGALLITENFQVLLKWNRSRYFATAVGTLADAIGE